MSEECSPCRDAVSGHGKQASLLCIDFLVAPVESKLFHGYVTMPGRSTKRDLSVDILDHDAA